MKTYKIKVNGKEYVVELESVTEGAAPAPSKPVEPTKTESVPTGGNAEVKSPMQGNIVKVNVKAGDKVKKGQVVAILEAMKLENEIVASQDGTVQQVLVNQGQTVNAGQVIILLG